MKRWLSILAVLGCIVALSGCKNENGAKQAYFNAKVLEVNKEYVDVRCIETFNSGISVDEEFSVTKDVVSAGGAPAARSILPPDLSSIHRQIFCRYSHP